MRIVFRQLLPLLEDRSTPVNQSDIRLSNILLRHSNSIHDIVLVPRSQVPTVVLFALSNLECQSAQFPGGKHGVSQSRERAFAAGGSAAQQLVTGRLILHPVPLCSSQHVDSRALFPLGHIRTQIFFPTFAMGLLRRTILPSKGSLHRRSSWSIAFSIARLLNASHWTN